MFQVSKNSDNYYLFVFYYKKVVVVLTLNNLN